MDDFLNKQGKFWIGSRQYDGEIIKTGSDYYLKLVSVLELPKRINLINGLISDTPIVLADSYFSHDFKDWVFFRFDFLFKNYQNNDFTFKKANFKFSNMSEWVQNPLLSIVDLKEILHNFAGEDNTFETNHFNISLLFEKVEGSVLKPFEFYFCLEYFEPKPFKEILNDGGVLNDLLSLFMYTRSNIKELILVEENNEINVYSNSFNGDICEFNFNNTLIDYYEIAGNLGCILINWFNIYSNFESALYLYFINMNNFNAESLFILYTQALEAYIRKSDDFDKFYMDESDYEYVKQKFGEFLNELNLEDSSHKQSLKNRIKYGNEYSLRKRLNLLMEHLGSYPIIKSLEDKHSKKFVSTIVDTRNYYTHYDKKEGFVKSGVELVLLAFDLRVLLTLCLLNELKIPEDLINSKLPRKIYPK